MQYVSDRRGTLGLCLMASLGAAALLALVASPAQASETGTCEIVENPTPTSFTRCPNMNLGGIDLSRRDLSYGDFASSNLSAANLAGATLTRANLVFATLSGAQLAGAELSEANLTRANLAEATLTGATMHDAVLVATDFTAARLAGTDASGANLAGAKLGSADVTDLRLANANVSDIDFREATSGGVPLLPPDRELTSADGSAVPVTWTLPALTDVTLACSPESGTLFVVGTTPVTCTLDTGATAVGRASARFTVTILPAHAPEGGPEPGTETDPGSSPSPLIQLAPAIAAAEPTPGAELAKTGQEGSLAILITGAVLCMTGVAVSIVAVRRRERS